MEPVGKKGKRFDDDESEDLFQIFQAIHGRSSHDSRRSQTKEDRTGFGRPAVGSGEYYNLTAPNCVRLIENNQEHIRGSNEKRVVRYQSDNLQNVMSVAQTGTPWYNVIERLTRGSSKPFLLYCRSAI